MSRIGKSSETGGCLELRGCEREGWGEMRVTANRDRVSFWGDENVMKFVVMVAWLCEYTLNLWIVYFQWVNCIVCEL